MFRWPRRRSTPLPPRAIRDTIFGDMPLSDWPDDWTPADEPWASFVGARDALRRRNEEEALRLWRRVTDIPNLESRHYLQAWHFLRQEGIQPPPDKSASLYGVVIEMAIPSAGVDLLDILAVYADGSAR